MYVNLIKLITKIKKLYVLKLKFIIFAFLFLRLYLFDPIKLKNQNIIFFIIIC